MRKRYKLLSFVFMLLTINMVSCVSSPVINPSTELVVTSLPNIVEYKLYDKFSIEGLVIKDTNGVEINDYDLSFKNGEVFYTSGIQKILVSKSGYKATTFGVTVSEVYLPSLQIDCTPNKLLYKVGDTFSLEGIKVTSGNAIINDYSCSLENNSILDKKGEYKVYIKKDGYNSASFIIYVGDNVTKEGNKSIHFYYINDFHGCFARNESNHEAGMSYISKYLSDKKSNALSTSILLNGGDMFQGGFESNYTYGQILVDSMNVTGFDAMILGNHEFDWGENKLRDIANNLESPVLSCNTFYSFDNVSIPEYIQPFTILERSGVTIGIIGAVRKDIGNDISGSISKRFYFPEATPFIKKYSDLLRCTYKCDFVIVGFHDGGFENGTDFDYPQILNNSSKTGLKYVDAIFLAHDHRSKKGNTSGIPYLECGCNGRYVGEVILNASYNHSTDSYLVNNSTVYNDNASLKCYFPNPLIDILNEKYSSVLTKKDEVITTFANSYSRDGFSKIICQAIYHFMNSHKEMFDNITIYFTSCNASSCRSAVSKGKFTYFDLEKVYPFTNYPCIQMCESKHLDYVKSDSYYTWYMNELPVYESGITHAATVNYIAENSNYYTSKIQISYVPYSFIQIKEMIIEYLKSGVVL